MRPEKLELVPRRRWADRVSKNWLGTFIRFEGDQGNDYQLFARSKPIHGHQPLVDNPHKQYEYVPDPNGSIHPNKQLNDDGTVNRVRVVEIPSRRTWTQIGGYQQGTMMSRTKAGTLIPVYPDELPGNGPWQLMINDRRDPSGRRHSNMIEWPGALSRESLIDQATETFDGRRTKRGNKPFVRQLRTHSEISNITTQERDQSHKRVVSKNEE